jgi:hypothetical protein
MPDTGERHEITERVSAKAAETMRESKKMTANAKQDSAKQDANYQQRAEDTHQKNSDDPGQVGPDSGGQSRDSQGLSRIADASDESVEELADTGQGFEADAVAGVEDAADHPETPVRTHEDFRRQPSTSIK